MNKALLLRIVNPLLFLLFLIQAVTGLIMLFELRIPGMETLLKVHAVNGAVFIVVIVIHLSLNWIWVRANYLRRGKPSS